MDHNILLSHVVNLCCLCRLHCCSESENPADLEWDGIGKTKKAKNRFNIKAFFMACSWGWLVAGSLVFILSAFYVVPLPTIQLADYIENTIQILIVVLAFLITYKVFTVEDTDIQKFMRRFRQYKQFNAEDDAEVAGATAGKLAKLLIDKYQKGNDTAVPGTEKP